jgi:ribonucleoside-diphosphate reductase alpha subunit
MFYVLKRNGERQDIHFDKITYRIAKLINPIELQRLNLPHLEFEKEVKFLNPVIVAQKTISSIYSGITTEELDNQSSEICVNLSTTHPSYAYLGGRIMISNLHKKTRNSFVEKIKLLSESTELIDPSYVEWIFRNSEQLDSMVDYDRDYLYDYFGYKTLEKAYLLKLNGKIIERPQDMLMRTAIMVQKHNGSIYCLEMIKRTYDMMSLGYYTHASPTLFNSLSKHRQLSSCFVENTEVMTMDGVKKIQEIQIGDKLVTHTGKVQTVSQLHKNPLGDRKVMNLEVYKTKAIKVTDNHRFWSISNDDKVPKWREVKNLNNSHFIAIPSYKGHDIMNLFSEYESKVIHDKEIENRLYHLFRMHGLPVQNESPFILCESFVDIIDVDNVKFLRVKRVSETDLTPEYVYTIGVDEDHSYNVEGLICENCFLLGTNDDLSDIATTWNSCAQISKWAGGIGLHVSNIRGKDSLIKGTGGRSNGLVPFLRVFNDIARWIDQGGKRPGSIAIYLEPHHPDIFEFLDLRKNFGSETERARDLFLALWVSDLFMKQVEVDGDWYLLSPDNCPGLTDAFGSNYEILYWQYVNEGKFKTKVKARKLWLAILDSQIETGMPYISYKDAVNKKSNQKNIGTIKSSNLCNEIVQYSDHKEYAVCNLASIALKSFIIPFDFDMTREWIVYSKPNCKYCRYAKSYLDSNNVHYTEVEFSNDSLSKLKEILHTQKVTFPQIFTKKETEELVHIGGWSDLYKQTGGQFNYEKLYDIAYLATINLNQVIDVNYYPVPQTRVSNMRHRPIGLGIQGLADALVLMKIAYDSDEAVSFNSKMMETIYLASVTASNDLAMGRTQGMKTLIEWFRESNEPHPEFYDESLVITDSSINELYHQLKPCKYELDRDSNLTTIGSYSSFDGSPFSEGKFQFDLWEKRESELMYPSKWQELREKVVRFGTRNSLLTALMPTASTSQILGNNECFEFFTNNIYTRKTQAGDFVLVNKYLVKDLISVGLWNDNMKNLIIAHDGSIQNIDDIPSEVRTIYKTMWEIKQIWSLKGSIARGPFVDQTQSLNIFMGEPDYQRLTSSHFYGWKNGLKTGMYYLRSKPSTGAIKFTIDPNMIKANTDNESKQEPEPCLSCSG